MTNPILKTQNLYMQYGQKTALNDFSLTLERGGVHCIVGSNGAGKSTLFRILLGLQTPTSGTAHILGDNCMDLRPETRGRIGYVNEEHTLPTWMIASDVKAMQMALHPNWNEDIYHEVIGNFDVDPKQKVGTLSRGERAGFNLSMVLAQSPEILILDEPTLGLDVVAKRAFLEALMFTTTNNGAGIEMTTIYCSHQMDEIERVADQLIVMERGGLKIQSTPEAFLNRVHFWIADFVGQPTDLNHPDILSQRTIEEVHHIYTLDQDAGFATYLTDQGALNVQPGSVSLDQAVNAIWTRPKIKPIRPIKGMLSPISSGMKIPKVAILLSNHNTPRWAAINNSAHLR